MRRLFASVILFFVIAIQVSAQTTTKYYKTFYGEKEVAPENARYVCSTTTHADGSITTEWKHVKNNKILYSKTYKGLEPVGIWKYQMGREIKELNYDFELDYVDTVFGDSVMKAGMMNPFMDSANYTAPKFDQDREFFQVLQQNIVYPEMAKDNNIMGKVVLVFIIRKTGEITNVAITHSSHIVLDKEAMRVVREMKIASPAKLNGSPENFYFTLPISFQLM